MIDKETQIFLNQLTMEASRIILSKQSYELKILIICFFNYNMKKEFFNKIKLCLGDIINHSFVISSLYIVNLLLKIGVS
jgi:hypothetical protein